MLEIVKNILEIMKILSSASTHIMSEVFNFAAIYIFKTDGTTRGKGFEIQRTLLCHKCESEVGNNDTF